MKRILILILLTLCSTICLAQNLKSKNLQEYAPLYKAIFPSTSNVYDWQLVGKVCTGCGAGYIGIERSKYTNEFGNYQYLIYLYTSSYNLNDKLTYTYFSKIKVLGYYNNQWVPLDNTLPFDMIVGTTPILAYTIFSSDPFQYILVMAENISAY